MRSWMVRWPGLSLVVLSLSVLSFMACEPPSAKAPLTPDASTFVVFSQDDLWGYKDLSGSVVIPATYTIAEAFLKDGGAFVVDDKGWGFINYKGEMMVRPFLFDNGPDPFSEGLARFVQDEKMGYYAPSGKIMISPIYDFVEPFKEGRARVCTGCIKVMDGEHYSFEGGTWSTVEIPATH